MTRTRPATFEERATWGTCPVCGVHEGEFCDSGYSPGADVIAVTVLTDDGNGYLSSRGDTWCHPERFNNSPTHVKLEAV